MARPQKFNADYFPHDANTRNIPGVKAIRRKFSHMGYAAWNFLLETLTSSNHFQISWDEVTFELLAADYDIEPHDLMDIIEYALKIGMLEQDGEYIFSPEHRNSLKPLQLKRERDRDALVNQADKVNHTKIIVSDNITKQTTNKIISNDNTVFANDNKRKRDESRVIGGFPIIKSKRESKRESKSKSTHTVGSEWKGGLGGNHASEFLLWLDTAFPAIANMQEPFDELQAHGILSKYSPEDINRVLSDFDNKRGYKNKNAYATFCSFAGHDFIIKSRKATTGRKYTYNEVCDEIQALRAKDTNDFQMFQSPDGVRYWMRKIDLISDGAQA